MILMFFDVLYVLDDLDDFDVLGVLDVFDLLDLAKVCSKRSVLFSQWLNDFLFTIYRGTNAPEL